MELGPPKDREKLWPGWELNPRPSGLITATPPTVLQGQTGAGCGSWRCQVQGNEYVQVQGRVSFFCKRWQCSTYFWTNWIIGLHITLYNSICSNISATRPTFGKNLTLLWTFVRRLLQKKILLNVFHKKSPLFFQMYFKNTDAAVCVWLWMCCVYLCFLV